MATREAVLWCYAYIGHAHPMESPTVEEVVVWLHILVEIDDDALRDATRAWCKSDAAWPPRAGQLREQARSKVRTYLDRSHREYDSQGAAELEAGYPDPLVSLRRVKADYDARFRSGQ